MIARQPSSPRVLCVMEVQRPSKKTWLKNNQPSSHSNHVCESIDSGVGSFEDEPCQGKGMTSTIETPDPAEVQEAPQNGEAAQKFQFIFLGFAVLDRRYTQNMLPWVISEVRRRRERQNVYLCVEELTVKALNVADGATTFQHLVQSITRCARSPDKKCFAYLVKSNDNTCSCHCYVFESVDTFSVRFWAIFKHLVIIFLLFFLTTVLHVDIFFVFLLHVLLSLDPSGSQFKIIA